MKLFVTVGAQMPFDRLIEAVDRWALAHPDDEVIAQIGDSEFVGRGAVTQRFLSPEAFAKACESATRSSATRARARSSLRSSGANHCW